MKISEWWFSLPVLMLVLVALSLGTVHNAIGAEKCADGTKCPAEPTDQELEDSCSDEGVSL